MYYPTCASAGLKTCSFYVSDCLQELSVQKTCVTYEDSTSNLDKDAAVCMAGHGINGRDLVFYALEGKTLKESK